MKNLSSKNFNPILMFLLILSAFFFQFCGDKPAETTEAGKTNFTDTVSVEAEEVVIRELITSKTFSGSLEGEEQANIISKIPERIMQINVKVGDYINSGTILFMLDKGGASSQFYQTQAVFLNAQKDLERMKNLFNEGAVSGQALDGTQTSYDVAKANFEAAKSTVEITSPLSGMVTAVNVNIGDIANPAIVLATVANIGRMKALFNVGESDLPSFNIGQPIEIYSELNPEIIQTGKLSQISKSANIESRTFEIQALFPNTKNRWFKPGMFCRINVNMKTKKDALTIPITAIVSNNSKPGVFVINENKVTFKHVTTGMTDGKYTEVLSGLSAGENVVTLGMNNLKNGTVVIISDK